MSILLKSHRGGLVDLSSDKQLLAMVTGGCGCGGKKVTKTTSTDEDGKQVDSFSVDEA